MFYCETCRVKNGWPEGWFKSRGPCEVCRKVEICNDVPSKHLPPVSATQAFDGWTENFLQQEQAAGDVAKVWRDVELIDNDLEATDKLKQLMSKDANIGFVDLSKKLDVHPLAAMVLMLKTFRPDVKITTMHDEILVLEEDCSE